MLLNDKQELFARNMAAGQNQAESCINAGYSKNGAAAAASRLMRNPEILARIEELRAQPIGLNNDVNKVVKSAHAAIPAQIVPDNDPMLFLQSVMNDERWPPKLRVDAAKTLMPYVHARIGEAGKKETALDAAIEQSRAGGLSARLEQKRQLKKVK
ncbi:terminase small subunit [Snodgrassella alvi]|uniref:terminase small subunit n=1 Tax=Snodgrassella alvi TaxID=1196083 RepID=UPI0034608653